MRLHSLLVLSLICSLALTCVTLLGGSKATAQAGYSVSANPSEVHVNAPVTVSWSAPTERPGSGLIGLYRLGQPDNAPVSTRSTGGAASGSVTFRINPINGISEQFEFRYVFGDYTGQAVSGTVTDAASRTISYEYDLAGRLKKITQPDLSFITFTYDLAGRRTKVTDAINNSTTYAYDGAYRLTSETNADNRTTSYGYNLMSLLTSRTDALGRVTNYEYDDFNRLVKTIFPPATTGATRLQETIAYDAAGNVTGRTDAAGRTTGYQYDAANRLTRATDAANQIVQVRRAGTQSPAHAEQRGGDELQLRWRGRGAGCQLGRQHGDVPERAGDRQ